MYHSNLYKKKNSAKKIVIKIPENVHVRIKNMKISIKGSKGEILHFIHHSVLLKKEKNNIFVKSRNKFNDSEMQIGTMCSLIKNSIKGVTSGFKKRLQLVGIGYRSVVERKKLILSIGFSHNIFYDIPSDIEIECNSQTEILITGINKQRVGQIAAEIRSYKTPEPYKGKGIRYLNELVKIKETKKK
ncbi:hypothetical protein AOE58_01865 [Candidatus Riesia pthiripubis]|uniref:50S ribosomal protein L6 n=1 Tax=Candidatus Riesia pthiripubis TaxID=428412 RepID=A0A1V0HPA4_9ENTR|nr:hypothetical protein AOE58_01865 [Candidatus Riesia pthiripubis]